MRKPCGADSRGEKRRQTGDSEHGEGTWTPAVWSKEQQVEGNGKENCPLCILSCSHLVFDRCSGRGPQHATGRPHGFQMRSRGSVLGLTNRLGKDRQQSSVLVCRISGPSVGPGAVYQRIAVSKSHTLLVNALHLFCSISIVKVDAAL